MIIQDIVPVRSETSDKATRLFDLHAGAVVKAGEKKNGYMKIFWQEIKIQIIIKFFLEGFHIILISIKGSWVDLVCQFDLSRARLSSQQRMKVFKQVIETFI